MSDDLMMLATILQNTFCGKLKESPDRAFFCYNCYEFDCECEKFETSGIFGTA